MNQKHRILPFVCLLSMGLFSCGTRVPPPIQFDEKLEFSTAECFSDSGGGIRLIGNYQSLVRSSRFRIYIGVTDWLERKFDREEFPVDKYNYEFVLRMEARAKDQGDPFFVRDVPLPDFPSAEKYRVVEPVGPGEFQRYYPYTLLEDEFAWKEEVLTEENQSGSIVYRLAALLKTTKEEAHKGFLEPYIFRPVKIYYWLSLRGSPYVYYDRTPLSFGGSL